MFPTSLKLISSSMAKFSSLMISPISFIVLLVFVFPSTSTTHAFTFNSSVPDTQVKCIESERQALLKFKDNLIDKSSLLSSWHNGEEKRECCKWYGIQCDKKSGHVIKLHVSGSSRLRFDGVEGKISDSLIDLPYLNYLNLSMNYLSGGRHFPSFIANLSRLEVLDLSYSFYDSYSHSMEWVSHLSSLRHLDLSGSQTNNWIAVINKLPNLKKLNLDFCSLQNITPSSLHVVNSSTSLNFISLSRNHLSVSIFKWLLKLNNSNLLVHLDLHSNNLNGFIPEVLKNMIVLKYLDLSLNQLEGKIPNLLSNMSSLQYLDLSYNNLQGEIPKSLWSICSLQTLSLSNSSISGQLSPSTNCSHHSLEKLDLSVNKITGSMPNFTLFTSLKFLDLSTNQLSGVVPISLGQLSELETLRIYRNFFQGLISKAHFQKLSKLTELDFSDNPSLVFDLHNNWIPPFQLNVLVMSSLRLGPHFPRWIKTRKNCETLDLSNTGIEDSLPDYFWDQISCSYTNISKNQITGTIMNSSLHVKYLRFIDLSSNRFVGPIPPFLFNATQLFLYENIFSSLNSMCDVRGGESFLAFLDVSNNQLSGQLPDCFSYFQKMSVLILSNNSLSGGIPTSMGYLSKIRSLHLDRNNLIGALPTSLKNCISLQVIDAGGNKLLGPIPEWIGESLLHLQILSLSSNYFYGTIPASLCHLQNLQILNLPINNLSGSVPNCLHNFTAMQKNGETNDLRLQQFNASFFIDHDVYYYYYYDEVNLMWKGTWSPYKKTLLLVRMIDLSSNKLTGMIPVEITQLIGLVSLNLSRNNLSGKIPSEMGQLKSLEFIDFSNNHIVGHIPASFAQIDRLSVLDLSNNNLSGKIPKGTQLQSFNTTFYMGNPQLCGDPLPKCPGEEPVPPEETSIGARNQENEMDILGQGFYVSMGLGFVVGFWGFCGSLLFNKSWRYTYFNFMNAVGDYVATMIALQRSKLMRMIVKS